MSMADLESRVRDLERRVPRIVQLGVVVEVDYPAKRVRVTVGERRSAWLRFTTTRAGADRSWWPPTIGEQVIVFAPNGDVVMAVVGQSLYQADHDAPADAGTIRRVVMGDGATVTYDRAAKVLTAELPGQATIVVAGSLSMHAGGDMSLSADGNVTIRGARVDLNP